MKKILKDNLVGLRNEIWNQTDNNKEACTYKTLYIRRALLEQIECIAAEHHTSFNHVVVSMIEACLSEEDATTEEAPWHLSVRFAASSPQGEPFYFAHPQCLPLRGGAAGGGGEVAAHAQRWNKGSFPYGKLPLSGYCAAQASRP